MKKIIVSIDLGGTNLKVALLNLNYKIIDKRVTSTNKSLNRAGLIATINDSVKNILESNGYNPKQVLGVGLGVPGPVDAAKGIVHFFPNIPGWKEVRLKTILSLKLKIPVSLDNDAKLMCLAEHKIGAARNSANALCITLGTGVGGGIIIGGKLYRGFNNAAGEIGHLPINEFGPRCNCGGIACLESYVGNNAILRIVRAKFKKNISLERLSEMAYAGNKAAILIWEQVGSRLAVALTAAVNLLNLDCIVIGGGVSGAGKILFDSIRRNIDRRAMSVHAKHVKLYKAVLGSDAGLIGAAILVKEGVS